MTALNVHTISLNVHTVALNVHTIALTSRVLTSAGWSAGARDCEHDSLECHGGPAALAGHRPRHAHRGGHAHARLHHRARRTHPPHQSYRFVLRALLRR
eukprot:1184367-Prorocentrum_minimum.AAC.2